MNALRAWMIVWILALPAGVFAQESKPATRNLADEEKARSVEANTKLLGELRVASEDPAKRAEARAMLDRARGVARGMNMAYQAELDKITENMLLATLKDGLDAGKTKEEAGDVPAALRAFDAALADFDTDLAKAWNRPETPEIQAAHRDVIEASDELVAKVETPAFEAKVPTRDLLEPKERPTWQTGAGAGLKFDGGSVVLEALEVPGRRVTGMIDLGLSADPPWHDLVLDLEFTIESGSFDLFLRYFPAKPNYLIRFGPKTGYELNEPHRVSLGVKGSSVELSRAGRKPQTDKLAPKTSRSGGLGFGLEAGSGSKVVISACTLKVLR